jgi:hypothetical protein
MRLNQLLSNEQATIAAQSAKAERERKTEDARTPVSSSLRGEFRGWRNGTVFELENGQRWRVLDNDFATKPLSSPKVISTQASSVAVHARRRHQREGQGQARRSVS